MSDSASLAVPIRSTIPARLDRLRWSPFHTRMVCGLGSAWILDGQQITIASSVTGQLTKPQTLDMTSTEVGLIASIYLVGEMIGALVFGGMSDKLGRRRLLITTLLSPIAATPRRRRDASHTRLTRPALGRHPEVWSSGLM